MSQEDGRMLSDALAAMIDKESAAAVVTNGIILPDGEITMTASACALFDRVAPTHTLFNRGGRVQRVVRVKGAMKLEIVTPTQARTEFERHARLFARRVGREGEKVLKRAVIPYETAAAFLECNAAIELLPPITGLLNCPMIVAVGSGTDIIGRGYHADTGLFVTGGSHPPFVEVKDAVASLKRLVAEYDFYTPGDRSRALASFITPALKLGGHITENVPVDVAEADDSQSGKTKRQRCVAAIYNEHPSLVANKKGGVGSVDESFSEALEMGRPFIQFDNFRGRFDSQYLEAFLTGEQTFAVRVPYKGGINIDPSRFIVMLSSNGVETTRDLANRASIVRNRKRAGFQFYKFEEGGLLQHIRKYQPYFLGCVFSIVCEWIARGRQRTEDLRHNFEEWAQTLDWIVQEIMDEAPLMDGHQEAQERVSNPDQTFLRNLAIEVARRDQLGQLLNASALCDIAITGEPAVAIPGLQKPEEVKGKLLIGSIMARLFKSGDSVVVDDFRIDKNEVHEIRTDGTGWWDAKSYRINRITRSAQRNTTKHNKT